MAMFKQAQPNDDHPAQQVERVQFQSSDTVGALLSMYLDHRRQAEERITRGQALKGQAKELRQRAQANRDEVTRLEQHIQQLRADAAAMDDQAVEVDRDGDDRLDAGENAAMIAADLEAILRRDAPEALEAALTPPAGTPAPPQLAPDVQVAGSPTPEPVPGEPLRSPQQHRRRP